MYQVQFKNSYLETEWATIKTCDTYEEAQAYVNSQNYHIDSHYQIIEA